MYVSIEIRGSAEVRRKLKRLGPSLTNFRSAMGDIGQDVTEYYQNTAFASQGGVFGKVWARLRPSTINYKSKNYPQYVNAPLLATGAMRDGFTYTPGQTSVLITNTAPYYKYHQSTAQRSKLPRRQMAGINQPVKEIVRERLREDIKKKIRSA